jgi:DNA-binding MarR family transcriptional regulator
MSDRTALVTEFVIEAFRLNGELLHAGDQLVSDIGLTSARWQVLGAIAMAPGPLPVAHTARNMGLSRQGVQRIANELEADGLIAFAPNPHHARAKLLIVTAKGERTFAAAMERQRPWAASLGAGLAIDDIRTALKVMRRVRGRLEDETPAARGASHVGRDQKHA